MVLGGGLVKPPQAFGRIPCIHQHRASACCALTSPFSAALRKSLRACSRSCFCPLPSRLGHTEVNSPQGFAGFGRLPEPFHPLVLRPAKTSFSDHQFTTQVHLSSRVAKFGGLSAPAMLRPTTGQQALCQVEDPTGYARRATRPWRPTSRASEGLPACRPSRHCLRHTSRPGLPGRRCPASAARRQAAAASAWRPAR